MERSRAVLRLALLSAHAGREASTDVTVQFDASGSKQTPTGVFANAAFKKGQLVLVPLTSNIQIGPKSPTQSVLVPGFNCKDAYGKAAHAWLVPKCELPPKGEIVRNSGSHCVCLYWCVRVAPDSTQSNLAPSTIQCKVTVSERAPAGVKGAESDAVYSVPVPVLVNTQAVSAGEMLLKAPIFEPVPPSKKQKVDA